MIAVSAFEPPAAAAALWTQQWTLSGLTPRKPAEMQRWRERLDDILNRLDKRDTQKSAIDALAATIDAGKAAVAAFLASTGRSPDHTLPRIFFFVKPNRVSMNCRRHGSMPEPAWF